MTTSTDGTALVRWRHEARVLAALREHGALRRAELAAAAGLSRTTLSEIVADLVGRGAVRVVSTDAARRRGSGRPAEVLALDPSSGQYLGIDLAHAAVHVAVVDASHDVIASQQRDVAPGTAWNERIRTALDVVDAIASSGTRLDALQGVGVGLPGPYSPAWSVDRSGARDSSAAARNAVEDAVGRRFGVAPLLDTNTRLAALAEAVRTPGTGEDLVYLRIAAGIGGGIVVGGRLVHGGRGLSGELGHATVRPDGPRCRCGKRGCLETVASVPAVLAACVERGVELRGLADLEQAVDRADPVVEAVLREAGVATGQVLAGTVLALNPTDVVVGGALASVAPPFVQQVASTITFEVHPIDGARPRVRPSDLGDSGGAVGAIVALQHRTSLLVDYPGGHDASIVTSPPRRSTS
ncbi:ROK family transcriptional regulator [Isoptericola sp. NPDC019482]|uniref:ROK family transcriptional regulator n=1 Tax=Isoptericola sp. NPDC019482 TaxID=3154688 RepID=UPI003472A570